MLIHEIFSSIQGEGIYVGYRQLFIRAAGCNISCEYCDELHSEPRYYDIDEILAEVSSHSKQWHHAVSITGGEPLLQVERLKELLPRLSLPVYLETNGTLPQYFKEIKDHVDVVSLDLKDGYEKEFEEFLELACDMDVFVKYVVMRDTSPIRLKEIAALIEVVNKDIPLIIQPVSPHGKIKHGPKLEDLLKLYNAAKKHLNEVRVIPQTHKMMGIR